MTRATTLIYVAFFIAINIILIISSLYLVQRCERLIDSLLLVIFLGIQIFVLLMLFVVFINQMLLAIRDIHEDITKDLRKELKRYIES